MAPWSKEDKEVSPGSASPEIVNTERHGCVVLVFFSAWCYERVLVLLVGMLA